MLTGLPDIHEIVLGALFVVVFAYRRFNTPHTNRSSTTALRYYTAATFYLLFGLALYSVLIGFPDLLQQALAVTGTGIFPDWAKRLSSPLLVALMLTVLLPNLPVLSGVDAWIKQLFQSMASIPLEVQLLKARLERARFHVGGAFQTEVTTRLALEGFDPGDIAFESSPGSPGHSPQQVWAKIAVLMTRLEGWKRERKFIGFVTDFADDFAALGERYRQLAARAKKCFELRRSLAAVGGSAEFSGVADYQRDFLTQADELLRSVYDFISRGILQSNPTDGSRNLELQKLGFQGYFPRARLSLNQLVCLFVGILLLVLSVFVLLQEGARLDKVVPRSAMIATMYVVAVCCAVYPKRRWRFARRSGDGFRPVAYYFAVGILAAVASRLISLLFGFYLKPGMAWVRFLQTYPWALMSFVTAFVTAFMMDNRPTAVLTRTRLRWIEGLAQAFVTCLSAVVVQQWLHAIRPGRAAGSAVTLTLSAIIGFAIGFLVPTWYREAPYRGERRLGERRHEALAHDPERRQSVDRRLRLQPAGVTARR